MNKLIYILILCSFFGFSQDKDKALIQANDLIFEANELVNEDFVNAEVEYRKAISKKPSTLPHATYARSSAAEPALLMSLTF